MVCTKTGLYHTRSPSASLQIKGLATKNTTVKWALV